MSFNKYIFLLFCILALSTVLPVFGLSSVTFMSKNEKIEATLTITDAFYTDLDNDEVYDIVSYFYLVFNGHHYLKVKLYVNLILPSGFVFSYKWNIGTDNFIYFGQINFYDHAIESGNYTLSIRAKVSIGGTNTGLVEYEFDPPGGSGGGDPCARLM